MTDKTVYKEIGESDPAPQDADQALKKRLVKRVAVAAVLIAALLGGLSVLDKLNAPPPKTAEEAPPLAVAEPQEAKPEEKPAEQTPPEEQKKAEEVPAEPEQTTSPAAPNKLAPARPLTKPAAPRLALMKPSEPLVAAKPAEPAAQLVRPHRAPAAGAPASRPLTQPHGQGGIYLLQLGMFSNTANAEELRAKLELAGIPSQIEARVQVGPFKNRQEAEQMRARLKQLGMEPGIVVAKK